MGNPLKTIVSLLEAKRLLEVHGISNTESYRKNKALRQQLNLPSDPPRYYKEWKSWPDFFNRPSLKISEFLPFLEAKALMKLHSVSSRNEYDKAKALRNEWNLPAQPYFMYEEWQGWYDFLGKDPLVRQIRGADKQKRKVKVFLSFSEARDFVHSLALKGISDWRAWRKTPERNKSIPSAPHNYYSEWTNWPDFLGNNKKAHIRGSSFATFEEAKEIVKKNNILSYSDYMKWMAAPDRPLNLPTNPDKYYAEFKGYKDFLGNHGQFNKPSREARERRVDFEVVKAWARENSISSSTDWYNRYKKGLIPKEFPLSMSAIYSDVWKGWTDFLSPSASQPAA